eukprot:CAMPEP_0171384106 /NCGR_PEP_ID=MMETSP0879-20121228/37933_1 /TAXON_ID=67004 /ORGANISM="Thalassiosira weissflogii, Strain CCMP1336" /LENGTH=390 /DNA_ID=CAMNT_0011896311 /DNA_START=255 /DNA_END=1427 /DNA_ORIENTATION=+
MSLFQRKALPNLNRHEEEDVENCTGPLLAQENSVQSDSTWKRRNRRRRQTLMLLLAMCFLFMLSFLSSSQPSTVLVDIGVLFLRTIVFPIAHRGDCLPQGNYNSNRTLHFAVTSFFQPKTNDKWNPEEVELIQLSDQNKIRYCQMHNYTFLNGTDWALRNKQLLDTIPSGPESVYWYKPMYLRDLLRNFSSNAPNLSPAQRGGIDWILYLDTDVIIINHQFDLQNLLRATPDDVGLIATNDGMGLNAGAFLIRNNDLGRQILESWMELDTNLMTVESDQSYLQKMFDTPDHSLREDFMVNSKHAALSNISSKSTNSLSAAMNTSTRPKLQILKMCALAPSGGMERIGKTYKPYWDGTYATNNFAVHFFARPDKLEQMKKANRGSITFFSR